MTTQPQNARAGGWIQTYTGRKFWPLDPRPDEIDIQDIAHALSQMCRYAGHCTSFYSVAQHSVLMAESPAVPAPAKLWALLHDASEAYLVDVPRPIKPHLGGYTEIEAKVMLAVCKRFGLPAAMPPSVKSADNRILFDEKKAIMNPGPAWDTIADLEPLGVAIITWPPVVAKRRFLEVFNKLTEPTSTREEDLPAQVAVESA